MHSFNLTFNGEIKPGYNPERAKRRFAALLNIEDPEELAACFSGEPVTLRCDLDRKVAADLFRKLDRMGIRTHLVRDDGAEQPQQAIASPANSRDGAILHREADHVDQSWAFSRAAVPRSGPPNTYTLFPFRATPALRERPRHAVRLMRRYLRLAVIAGVALATAALGHGLLSPPPPVSGPLAMSALHGGGLVQVVPGKLLLHDRAGVGSEVIPLAELGLSEVLRITPAADREHYLVLGRGAPIENSDGAEGLWLCQLGEMRACETFGPQPEPGRAAPANLAVHPFNGMVLQAFPDVDALRKLDATGAVRATARRRLSDQPALHLQDGLLYTNSTEGPALSVLRYEDNALGKQLDEILLLAPEALEAGRERVGDFTYLGDKWWALLRNPDTGDSGLYLFDRQWGYLREVSLPGEFSPQRLLAWGEKMLVLDPHNPGLARFNSEGQAEVPLESNLLTALIEEQRRRQWQHDVLWRGLLILLGLAFTASAALTWWQHLRWKAFGSSQLRGAEPIESASERIRWVVTPDGRERILRRTAQVYLAGVCALLLGCVAARVEPYQLAALLFFLAGPAAALALYRRYPPGRLGVLGKQLVLVDHRNIYHVGSGARILYRTWFLMIDDVLVHAGPRWLPAFDTEQLLEEVVPLAQTGLRVDRRSAVVRLLEARHPLALGTGILLLASATALTVLALGAL